MKKRFGMVLCVTLIWVMGCGFSFAAGNVISQFSTYDTNNDQKITRAEYMAACKRQKAKCEDEFDWYDRNQDNVLTRPEFEGKLNAGN